MASDKIRLGPVFWICGCLLAVVMSFALVFLGIVPLELIAPTFVIAWGGGMAIILVAGRVGVAKQGSSGSFVLIAGLAGLLLIIVESQIFGALFGVTASVDPANFWLVNVLFAVYEETLFLGVRIAGKAGGLPDLWIIGIEAAAFLPYHALHYPLTLAFFFFFLIAVRLTLSAISLMTDHSDPPYIAHMGYNFIVSVLV